MQHSAEIQEFNKTRSLIGLVLRLLLGLIFVLSSVLKFLSLEGFESYLFSFDVFSLTICSYGARLLLFGEMALGLLLMTTLYKRFIEWVALGVLVVFSFFLVFLWITGNEGNCHCMGEAFDMSPQLSLLKNAVLLVLLYFSTWSLQLKIPWRRIFLSILFFSSFVYAFILKLPFGLRTERPIHFDERLYQELVMARPVLQEIQKKDFAVVCFFSVKCIYCKHAMRKLQVLLNNCPKACVQWVVWGTESGLDKFIEETNVTTQPYIFLDPRELMPITGNRMPILLFLQQGKIVGKMSNGSFDDVEAWRLMNEEVNESFIDKRE